MAAKDAGKKRPAESQGPKKGGAAAKLKAAAKPKAAATTKAPSAAKAAAARILAATAKQYADGSDDGSSSDDGGDEEEFDIDYISEHKGTGADRRYLVYWEGYPEEPTWEPQENLDDCEVFASYLMQHPV